MVVSVDQCKEPEQDESLIELERIEGMHILTTDHLERLILAPIDLSQPGLRILDSATAGGRWLKDLSQRHGLKHEYVGTDVSELFFPKDKTSIQFFKWDITTPWPKDRVKGFNLVHQRFTLGAIKKALLKEAVMNLINVIGQGGWIQLTESYLVGMNNQSTGLDRVWFLLREVYNLMGSEPDMHKHLRGWFEEAGLVDIQEAVVNISVGTSDHDLMTAQLAMRTMILTTQKLVAAGKCKAVPKTSPILRLIIVDSDLLADFGKTAFPSEDLDNLCMEVEKALGEEGGSYTIYAIWGRKP